MISFNTIEIFGQNDELCNEGDGHRPGRRLVPERFQRVKSQLLLLTSHAKEF